jgi:hypothetical protein
MAVVTVTGAGLAPRPAAASIVVAMDLPTLVREADHIAVVDVVSTTADWDAKHERIFSTIDLKVVERWKGAAAAGEDHLRIVQPGGTVGDLTMTVTGLSTFSPGERALVFLRGTSTQARVLGMGQGKRPMRLETVSGKWLVQAANLHQSTLVQPRVATPTNGKLAPLPAAATARTPVRERGLEDFRSEVKTLIGTTTP